MGTRSRPAREGISRARETCSELGDNKEPSRNRMQDVCKCEDKGEAEEGLRISNDFIPHL